VTVVEATIIGTVFLLLVLGMMDLSIALYHQHLLTHAAQDGARQAALHGSLAGPQGSWGPEAIGPTNADQDGPLSEAIRPLLTGMDPAAVEVQAEWLDGNNEPGSRVQVTATTSYRPILTCWLSDRSLLLEGRATMRIAH